MWALYIPASSYLLGFEELDGGAVFSGGINNFDLELGAFSNRSWEVNSQCGSKIRVAFSNLELKQRIQFLLHFARRVEDFFLPQ